MNSEIRASSALLLASAQTGSTDLSIQNPLFSIGAQDAFPHVLKQQVSDRQDAARASSTTSTHQERKRQDIRQDTQANDRQGSGKRLPERAEPSVSKPPSSAQRISKDNDNPVQSVDERQAMAGDGADIQAGEEPTTSPALSEDKSAETDNVADTVAPDPASVAVPPAPQIPVDVIEPIMSADSDTKSDSVLEELALLQAQSDSQVEQPMTLPDAEPEPHVLDDASAQQALDAVQAAQTLQQNSDVSLENATALQVQSDESSLANAAAEKAQGIETVQLAQSAASVEAPVVRAQTQAQIQPQPQPQPQRKTEAPSTQAATLSAAQDESGAAPQTADHSGTDAHDDTDSALLKQWELGPDTSQADKNAEGRAEFSKVMAATPDRSGQLKEQLAVLAQQVSAAAPDADKKAEIRKADTVSEIKPTVFSRTLEQLSSTRSDVSKPVSTGIQTPVYNKEWASEMGQRLVMMMSSKLKSAEIHLNPKDLGPVEVRIRMHEDKAHVVFTSQVAQTREALEQAVPRLREMLDQNGVALGNVDVQDHGARQSRQQEQMGDGRRKRDGTGDGSVDSVAESDNIPTRMVGLVDYYA